jgi:hypothetical protein
MLRGQRSASFAALTGYVGDRGILPNVLLATNEYYRSFNAELFHLRSNLHFQNSVSGSFVSLYSILHDARRRVSLLETDSVDSESVITIG